MTIVTKHRGSYTATSEFSEERFKRYFNEIVQDTGQKHDQAKLDEIVQDIIDFVNSFETVTSKKLNEYVLRYTNEAISKDHPDLKWVCASALRRQLYKDVSTLRGFDYKEGLGDFYTLLRIGVESGILDESLIDDYSKNDIDTLGSMIKKEYDKNLDFAGLGLLIDKYLPRNYNDEVLVLPQEMFMLVSMYIMKDEDSVNRLEYVKDMYESLGLLLLGLATPTLLNAGRPTGSLSSCHIVTVGDNLQNIMDTNKQIARFSQNGAGTAAYLGFLRGSGSWIRGYKGRASGVVHPSRLLNVIGEYVDQLGSRKAGIALYLPLFHSDIQEFLELRLKTGTQEKRAHSIQIGVCINDEFMRRLEKREMWTLFDPYEFEKVMGVNLNKLYDLKKLSEGETPNKEDHAFTYYYRKAENSGQLQLAKKVQATEIYKGIYQSRKTSGVPYLFFTDTVNRKNPNKHAGMIYSSNLCTEIFQNMSADSIVSETILKNGIIETKVEAGDLVTCNLSSINQAKLSSPEYEHMYDKVIASQTRALDNVISLQRAVVPQSIVTNDKYRGIGAGTMGIVEYLTNNSIKWESEEATKAIGELYKRQLKAMIKASHELAMEKGSYPLFEGSDWNTGKFFSDRGFVGEEWQEYIEMAKKGMRNSVLMATAPTSSNAIITNTSPSADPMYEVIYKEKKDGFSFVKIPSNYNNKTKWFMKSGFEMDEMWAINHIAEATKYTDQGISHNMHVNKDIKASEMLRLDMGAWKKGLKSIYYTYTSSMQKPEDCLMCQ